MFKDCSGVLSVKDKRRQLQLKSWEPGTTEERADGCVTVDCGLGSWLSGKVHADEDLGLDPQNTPTQAKCGGSTLLS